MLSQLSRWVREVGTLGEDHDRVTRALGLWLMAAISTSMSPPRGSTKRFGSRVPSMSISGYGRERLVHHDPRPPAMAAQ